MRSRAQLQLLVQDHEGNPIIDADAIIQRNGESHQLIYDENLRRYTVTDLEVDEYVLSVTGPADLGNEERRISLTAGENYSQTTLGPENMPSYVGANGERAFFEPDEGRALLFASGRGARQAATDFLAERNLDAEEVKPPKEQPGVATADVETFETGATLTQRERSRDEVTLLVELPSDEEGGVEALQDAASGRFAAASEGISAEEPSVRVALPMYRNQEEGRTIEGLTDEVIVKFEPGVSEGDIAELADEYDFEVLHPTAYAENGYVWRRQQGPTYDILDTVETLREMPGVIYAEPNVAIQVEYYSAAPSDFLYPEQPHLDIVDVEVAWDALGTLDEDHRFGNPEITIAIADSGVDPTHPDLTGRLTNGSQKLIRSYDFVEMAEQDPTKLDSDHGTKSASSAAAQTGGTLGVSGVAGNCSLIGMRILGRGMTWDEIANCWLWAAKLPVGESRIDFPDPPSTGADVISNSWGPASPILLPHAIDDVLDTLVRKGRGGRGCIVCFSAGNLGYTEFAHHHRFAADPRTIAVGASINRNPTNPCTSIQPDPAGERENLSAVPDTRSYFNPFGPEMDLVAPSHTSYADRSGDIVDPIVAAVPVDWGNWPGDAVRMTTLAAPATQDDEEISVEDSSGLTTGEHLLIGVPGAPDREFHEIARIDGDTVHVGPLSENHPSGEYVVTGPNDYERSFGGTSHACPTVAGAAALVLSVDPNLTHQEVREILHHSADPIDIDQSHFDGKWFDRDGDGKMDFSLWYGHGRLNVRRAVELVVGEPARIPAGGLRGQVRDHETQLQELRRALERQHVQLQEFERRLDEIQQTLAQPPSAQRPPGTQLGAGPGTRTEEGTRTGAGVREGEQTGRGIGTGPGMGAGPGEADPGAGIGPSEQIPVGQPRPKLGSGQPASRSQEQLIADIERTLRDLNEMLGQFQGGRPEYTGRQ